MKVKLLIISSLVLLQSHVLSGQYHQFGVFGGGSNFSGDVGYSRPHLPNGYAFGAFYRFNINRHWALKAQFNYGFIQSADSLSSEGYKVNRNLSFQSEIWEGSIQAEFNFFEYEPGTKLNHTPYVMGGFGLFWFNPRAKYQGQLYDLQPLATEGQGTSASDKVPYQLASNFFVFGLGYKVALGESFSMAWETTFRHTGTDYLDDVSGYYADPSIIREQNGPVAAALSNRTIEDGDWENRLRGNPQNDDWYIFTGITFQYKLDSFYEKCFEFFK